MATQNEPRNPGNQSTNPQGNLTEKEIEMAAEQKGGQGSKGASDQHGAHGSQSVNPNGKLPSGQDGAGQDGNAE